MKYLSLLFLIVLSLTLSGCFTKNVDMETGTGTQETETEQQEATDDEDTQDDIVEDDTQNNKQENDGEQNQESQNPETTNNQETVIDGETSASGSIQDEELESYEEDLEDLFKDILGELDDEEVSE